MPHSLSPESDADAANWWLEQLDTWGVEGIPVSAFVPHSHSAVCQLFHRWTDPNGRWATWKETAQRLGFVDVRALDTTREIHRITAARNAGFESSAGQMDRLSAEALVPLLTNATSTPEDVLVAVWTGYGDEPQRRFPGAAFIETEALGHFLLRGPLIGVLEPLSDRPGRTEAVPGVWWPADRAWFVATEIDFEWTFVAGGTDLIDRLVMDDRLEVARTTFDAPANRAAEPS